MRNRDELLGCIVLLAMLIVLLTACNSGSVGDQVTIKCDDCETVELWETSHATRVVGEVELLVPLNEAETLMGKVYNRQNEIQFDIIDSEGYTQGAGISYRFEFANSQEFLEKVGLKKAEGEKLLTKQERDSIKTAEKALRQKEKELKKKEDAGAR